MENSKKYFYPILEKFARVAIVFVTCALLFVFSACDDFLDSPLKTDYTTENYFTSENNAVMATNGIYQTIYSQRWWLFGDVASDDAVKGGVGGDGAEMIGIDDYSARADNGEIANFWKQVYTTISQANNVITYVKPMDIPLKNRLIGEATFFRAFSYFWLVNVFGEVPYKDKPQNSDAAINVGLSSVETIYGKIEEDLKFAANSLPAVYPAEKGRITKGAAFAMLAKVYLYQQKYQECLNAIDSVENLKQYDLISDYSNLFHRGAENSVEVIFGLRFNYSDIAIRSNEFCVDMSPRINRNFNNPTQNYVDCLLAEQTFDGQTDPRLDASIGRDGMPWYNGTTFDATWSPATGYLVKKYDEDDYTDITTQFFGCPYHYLRFADVLLMKAEALNELHRTNDAFAPVNRVRNRAHLVDLSGENEGSLRDKIRIERRRELAFECHRFFDIMRYGKDYANAALKQGLNDASGSEDGSMELSNFKWTDKRPYFLIPQTERDANKALN